MYLFGSLNDLDEDPVLASHILTTRHVTSMMDAVFRNPFELATQNVLTDGTHRGRMPQGQLQMMPFDFPPIPSFGRLQPNMGRLFTGFDNMPPSANCHSFTSRSVMTMGSGPDGRPQVYQETMSTTTAPGGVKETKQTVSDSRTGVKKMAIGHHIGDRAHILEREHNLHSGEREERQEFINLEEEEAESFNNEWETRTRRAVGAIGGSHYGNHAGHSRSRPDHKQLALPDPSASRHSSSLRWAPSPRRTIRQPYSSKIQSSAHASSSDSGSPRPAKSTDAKPSTAASFSATVTGNRKREHTPETKACKKRQAVSDSDV